ncbi:hypothetical protein MWU75_08085 [Ornithinimicrobium sp. F0845]|uniref:hypothetical protein n=1 Tax=Ornithinimicrobium sp. F0845 TaxID=2926412 RepID=UPI001FF16EAB|nr:hypothetical protein [Ornithinimicrobium sp. F0845]MCK0112092.1 hypothetical protein [Ornithinimicrobium sp. F0845]
MTEPGAITARAMLAFLLATWPRRVVLSLVLLVPVVVAAVGGFGPADPPPREVEPGTVTDTGAYRVVPRSFFVSETVDAGSLEEGERWVGARVQITNQGTQPISVTFDDPTFELPADVPNDGSPNPYEVLRVDTGARLGSAQPGVTYEVALLWRTTGLQDPPAELTLTMNQSAWTEWNIEAGYHTWRATADAFYVHLPRGEAPASILEEEDE